ncbi:unnamed protein product [Schistosoma curassoni]|uniref:Uncharacterized protein n=1 Tax=Schistosoma curassoni TaxID=6186 RepID=A0A183JMA8_9TREM|nr:unnamed protein product [Schistosoma curassoni]
MFRLTQVGPHLFSVQVDLCTSELVFIFVFNRYVYFRSSCIQVGTCLVN